MIKSNTCEPEFYDESVCCEIHGEKSYPSRYRSEKDCIVYSCGGMKSELKVSVSNLPDVVLNHIYRKVSKTNNSIRRNGGNPKHSDLVSRLSSELKYRDLEVPDTSLTHKAVMQKDQALSSNIPAIIKIGSAVGEYEFGTLPNEMIWSVLVTEDEAQELNKKYDDVKIEEVTIKTKS